MLKMTKKEFATIINKEIDELKKEQERLVKQDLYYKATAQLSKETEENYYFFKSKWREDQKITQYC